MAAMDTIKELIKALEAGGYNAKPTELIQGTRMEIEDLDLSSFKRTTFSTDNIRLWWLPPPVPRKYVVIENLKQSCECGAAKVGAKDFAAGHSSWCPVKG